MWVSGEYKNSSILLNSNYFLACIPSHQIKEMMANAQKMIQERKAQLEATLGGGGGGGGGVAPQGALLPTPNMPPSVAMPVSRGLLLVLILFLFCVTQHPSFSLPLSLSFSLKLPFNCISNRPRRSISIGNKIAATHLFLLAP